MSSSTTTLDLTLPANLSNVNGQTILITGGASGLGEAMFRRFAAHG
jgi:NADPH:quinone reductase-like Zn-dependent oxidoreductase